MLLRELAAKRDAELLAGGRRRAQRELRRYQKETRALGKAIDRSPLGPPLGRGK